MMSISKEGLERLPRPTADKVLYDSILEKGFQTYPDRYENYLLYKNSTRERSLPYLPILLDIENVSRCNYACTMCPVSELEGRQRADDMTFEMYKGILSEQRGLIEIKLQGLGEPTMGKEYVEMIEYARSRHLWVRSSTNASRLHLNDMYKRVVDSDICELQISVDGASKGTYEKIRQGGKFDRVADNCKLINQYAVDQEMHRTRMWVVVQKDNFDELDKFPQLASDLGFSRLTLSFDLNNWGRSSWEEYNETADVRHLLSLDKGLELYETAKSIGVDLSFWFIDKKYSTNSSATVCPWPFHRLYISSDMRAVPCCMMASPEVMDLGDASNINEVWNSAVVQNFRNAHLDGDILQVCRSCYQQW